MPEFFNGIKRNARYGKISGNEIKYIASRFSMENRIGVLITELKAAGLINPCFSFVLGLKEKDVTYESISGANLGVAKGEATYPPVDMGKMQSTAESPSPPKNFHAITSTNSRTSLANLYVFHSQASTF